MKANKFFAAAFAALTLVGFSSCEKVNPDEEKDLALDQTSVTIKVGETATITATVEATWVSSNEAVATVKSEGLTAVVTGVAEGNAIVTATTKGGQAKTCVVLVQKEQGQGGGKSLKGSKIWPMILDGTTRDANESKIVASFQPNDVDQFLYIWDGDNSTYAGNDNASGLNFHGNSDGYMALTVLDKGWAGAGFCLTDKGNGWQAAEALRAAIVDAPDDYFLHLAIKSTDNYSHCFYFMGNEGTKFGLGPKVVYDAPAATLKDFTRDGSWAEFDIPMSSYAAALASSPVAAGVNVFVMLSEGVQGAQLNLDAVYFYKK